MCWTQWYITTERANTIVFALFLLVVSFIIDASFTFRQMLLQHYDGKVPGTMEDLLKLPGVGRKTANLLLGDLYGAPGSVVCDTHCIRICGRLGLSQGKDPEKVERQLRAILPPEESSDFCHRIVLFGREICTARSPRCAECPLSMHCAEFVPPTLK